MSRPTEPHMCGSAEQAACGLLPVGACADRRHTAADEAAAGFGRLS
jgi:hypothetical protein